MRLTKLFTEHPASVGETYGQHLRSAGAFAIRLLVAGAACLTHAVLPFLFKQTASRFVGELHGRMITNRNRLQRVLQRK